MGTPWKGRKARKKDEKGRQGRGEKCCNNKALSHARRHRMAKTMSLAMSSMHMMKSEYVQAPPLIHIERYRA